MMTRITAFASCFLLAAVAAAEGDKSPLYSAFDYRIAGDAEQAPTASTGVEGVSYMTDCCCEPSCEAPCDCCDDCGCGCGDECGCGDACGCGSCAKKAKPNPCMTSHKGLFYANDFSYLKDPCYNGCCLGDCMKLMDTCCGTLDIGGQLRFRYHHEEGMGRTAGNNLGFQDTEQDFLLTRLRLYTNWKMNDWARFYAEGIVADAAAADDYLPRGIDRNYGDFLNLFFDLKLTDSTSVRIGRQELLYGAQRQVSPLDWANTRRTFEGIKLTYGSDNLLVDAFYTNFVPVVAGQFDEADYDRSFYGVYATYTGSPNTNFDLYYLGFDDERPGSVTSDFSIHTFGARMFGGSGAWLWDCEAAYQTGRQSGLGMDHRAGMWTLGAGRKLDCAWTPTVWFYYDYASGNDGDGSTFNRYNQLFPLAHKYLGFIDAVARSNISSPNCLVTMKPTDRLSLLFWYYYFGADVAGDLIPGVAVPSSTAMGGNQNTTSDDFGNELDMIAKYQISPRSNILFGYSHLWRGSKVVGTNDINFFYTQWELNF